MPKYKLFNRNGSARRTEHFMETYDKGRCTFDWPLVLLYAKKSSRIAVLINTGNLIHLKDI